MMKARELLEESRSHIGHEADWIVCDALGGRSLRRSELSFRLDEELQPDLVARTRAQVRRRLAGEPLQYILGVQSFLGHEYRVGPQVLVPRPETEFVISESLSLLKELDPRLGFEVGLGSGVLSIELLRALPHLRMHATEVSLEAQQIAKQNALLHLGECWRERLEIITPTDALEVGRAFQGRADFLISNPPYLKEGDEISPEVLRYEPRQALIPENGDPLYFYRSIAESASRLLHPRGMAVLEIAHERADAIIQLLQAAFEHVECRNDLTSRPRLLIAQGVRHG
jgi:release factor glutamine methyltransferase